MFKSIILKVYSNISCLENLELERTKDINNLSTQILKENEYLRYGIQNVLGNTLNQDLGNLENQHCDLNVIPVKKKRNPTQINFDFLDKELIEGYNKSEEDQVIKKFK